MFENADIKGALVSLELSYAEMIADKPYSTSKQYLLGEFAAAAILLAADLKFEGSLSLQARGEGIGLIVAECNETLEYRGVVQSDNSSTNVNFEHLFRDSILAITVMPKKGQQYQGIIPLEGDNLATCLASYFNQSEQLPTWFYIVADKSRVTGLMLQAMPKQVCVDEEETQENWSRLVHLASTLSEQEMLHLDHQELLYRLYHEEKVRLFEAKKVRYQCSCSVEGMERGLLSLGEQELLSLLAEQGDIKTQCHFCFTEYVFNKMDVVALIQGAGSQNTH
jgi:molecular chaperone Hsp33